MNIVITGAARGIGKAIACAFAAEGHTLLLCAKNEDGLKKTAAQIKTDYPGCIVYFKAVDLTIKEEVNNFGDWCLALATPDILINNAGTFTPGNIINEADGNLETMMNTNLYSSYYLSRKLLPAMVAQAKGHVFNICSIAGLQAYNGGGSYGISKYALNGFSQNLRHELKTTGIKVTTAYPGAVLTDSWGDFDNSTHRIMEATDVASMILACTKLSAAAVPEEIVLRPQLGDL